MVLLAACLAFAAGTAGDAAAQTTPDRAELIATASSDVRPTPYGVRIHTPAAGGTPALPLLGSDIFGPLARRLINPGGDLIPPRIPSRFEPPS